MRERRDGIGGEGGGAAPHSGQGGPVRGERGVTEAVATGPEPGPRHSAAAAAPSPSVASPEEGWPPHKSPPSQPSPLPRTTSGPTTRRQAAWPNTERPQPGKLLGKEELGESS